MENENGTNFRGEHYFTSDEKLRMKNEPETPIDEDFGEHDHLDKSFKNEQIKMRKSMSMNDIAALKEDFMDLILQHNTNEVYNSYEQNSNAPQPISKTKFVSMAEAIYHYHTDTPGRFHSSRPQKFCSQGTVGPSSITIPQSPMLRCKARSRPLRVMSQKEKEEMELEETRKFKFKANPIPKAVLEGNVKFPDVSKKPLTVPEPFNLTEINKKPHESPEQVTFKARPAPKHILKNPCVPVKPPVHITQPISPKFHYKKTLSEGHHHKNENVHAMLKSTENLITETKPRQGPIRPAPFSFEKRDEQMKKNREEKIKQLMEEERKQATQFKARPIPAAVKKVKSSATVTGSSYTTWNKENFAKFEAKPATVLYKEPFRPKLEPDNYVKQKPFQLTSEKRAAEREKYDQYLKEIEEEKEKHRKQREKVLQEAEQKAIAQLRAKAIHHAKPVPVSTKNPYMPEKSVVPLTIPETPKFVRKLLQRKH